MEFYEKLQELRRSRGLTQEELAEALYVSRTTISKWESGRGYPSIDSLKEIASFFSVSIDELLSGEKLISIAEQENRSNIRRVGDVLFGMVDVCSFLLILLPLYPNVADGFVYSVNLFAYAQTSTFNLWVYWVFFVALTLIGAVKVLMTVVKTENMNENYKILTGISLILSILSVLFLAMAREAYAIVVAFMLLLIKTTLLFKCMSPGEKTIRIRHP